MGKRGREFNLPPTRTLSMDHRNDSIAQSMVVGIMVGISFMEARDGKTLAPVERATARCHMACRGLRRTDRPAARPDVASVATACSPAVKHNKTQKHKHSKHIITK